MRQGPLPNLSDVDLRLLRVFHSVVANRGLAAAQGDLGVTQATISNQLSQLELRLGLRLCERGRGGFYLTSDGETVHAASRNLFRSIENFRSIVASVRGELTGEVQFGTVDAMWSNDELGLAEAFESFAMAAPKVLVHSDIASPQDLVKGLLEDRYHLILTPEQDFPRSVRAMPLFRERQDLYCGQGHELYAMPDAEVTQDRIADQAYAARSYMQDWAGPLDVRFRSRAIASHMESIALLILSGRYIGYLPDHFAARWTRRGEMRRLLAGNASYVEKFYAVHRRREKNRVVRILFDCLSLAIRAAEEGRPAGDPDAAAGR